MILEILVIAFVVVVCMLMFPVKILLRYDSNGPQIKICYLFFKFDILRKSKRSYKLNNSKIAENESWLKKIKSYFHLFKKIFEIRNIIFKIIKLLFEKIKIEKMHIFVKVSASDAKNCALNYYYISTFSNYLINFFGLNRKTKKIKFNVKPSFLDDNIEIRLNLKIKFYVLMFLISASYLIFSMCKKIND